MSDKKYKIFHVSEGNDDIMYKMTPKTSVVTFLAQLQLLFSILKLVNEPDLLNWQYIAPY